jgi:AraC-like DNA-binding protein
MGPQRVDYQTTDVGEAVDLLDRVFATRARLDKPPPDFRLRIGSVGGPELGSSRTAFQGRFRIAAGAVPQSIFVIRLASGHMGGESGGVPIHADDGRLFLTRAGAVNDVVLDHPDVQLFSMDAARIEEFARELSGRDRYRLRFTEITPISPERERTWAATARFVVRGVLADPAAWASPIIRGQAFRSLGVATVHLFPNNLLDEMGEVEEHATPASVRRAIAFVDEHLEEDISVRDIAEAARLSVRGLQAAFHRYLSETPLGHVRRARLDAARRDLIAAAREGTVAAISLHWGFANQGRFAREYREAYGELPSATLRR